MYKISNFQIRIEISQICLTSYDKQGIQLFSCFLKLSIK